MGKNTKMKKKKNLEKNEADIPHVPINSNSGKLSGSSPEADVNGHVEGQQTNADHPDAKRLRSTGNDAPRPKKKSLIERLFKAEGGEWSKPKIALATAGAVGLVGLGCAALTGSDNAPVDANEQAY